MTLGNMRQNDVRGLFVTCNACGYHSAVNVDRWPDDVPVPGPRTRDGAIVNAARGSALDPEGLGTAMMGERARTGGKTVEVVRFGITDAGRRALER
jgi:hypothetical protein